MFLERRRGGKRGGGGGGTIKRGTTKGVKSSSRVLYIYTFVLPLLWLTPPMRSPLLFSPGDVDYAWREVHACSSRKGVDSSS